MQIERNRLKKFQLARVGGYLQAMIDDSNSRWPIQQVVGAGLESGTARLRVSPFAEMKPLQQYFDLVLFI